MGIQSECTWARGRQGIRFLDKKNRYKAHILAAAASRSIHNDSISNMKDVSVFLSKFRDHVTTMKAASQPLPPIDIFQSFVKAVRAIPELEVTLETCNAYDEDETEY